MNATCPAGIPKPQRVSDLGRLLNPEITAPARPHSTWCLQHQHGACPSARRPLQHPHGAWPSTRRPRLAMCEATLHGHTAPCVSPNFQKDQLPQRRSVSIETWRLSHLALRDDQLPHQDRRRPLRVPFGTPRPTTCTSRPVRHDAVGVSFAIHRQVLLPAFHYHFRHELQTSRAIRDHGLRANQTTAHDETSRARRQDVQTAPCASTARRRHPLARTAAIRGRVPDYQKIARTVCFSI